MPRNVDFDRAKTERLRTAYKRALAAGAEQINFEGRELLTGYAKYLLEYLDTQFTKKDPSP